jgi:hypothetical protein
MPRLPRFADLRVWRDLNGNGVSEAGELQSLTAAGIASISLASTHLTTPQTIAGNSVTDLSTFTWTNGTTGTIADVWFTINQAFSFDARPVEIVPKALFLPTLRGYGTLSSLTAQMSRDPILLSLVQAFVDTPLAAVTDAPVTLDHFARRGMAECRNVVAAVCLPAQAYRKRRILSSRCGVRFKSLSIKVGRSTRARRALSIAAMQAASPPCL